jgi:mRNA interferase MazF
MAEFIKGDVVVVPFPFSDLTNSKRRPALVLAGSTGEDVILCQITSQAVRDDYAIILDVPDFYSGGLQVSSHIRPNRLFTADCKIILYRIGSLHSRKMSQVIDKTIEMLRQ